MKTLCFMCFLIFFLDSINEDSIAMGGSLANEDFLDFFNCMALTK